MEWYFDGAAAYAVHRDESGRWSVWAYAQQEPSRRRICRIAVIEEPKLVKVGREATKVGWRVCACRTGCIWCAQALAVNF
jgi:hypothetical protein